MGFTLQQLKVFVAVATHQNVSDAADALHLRQSTVSFHLRALEETAGVRLFSSAQHRRALTAAGHSLLQYAKSIIATTEKAEHVMADFQQDRQQKLLIGTSHVPATYVVPMVIQQFHQRYPEVRISVETMPTPMVRRRLEERQIDFGFVMDSKPLSDALIGMPVLQDQIGCVFSPDTGLQWLKPPITADLLRAVPLIGHRAESSTAQVCADWAESQGGTLDPVITIGSIDMIKMAVKLGMGAALLSKLMVYEEIKAGDLLYAPLFNPPVRELKLIYHQEPGHPFLQGFIQIVEDSISGNQWTFTTNRSVDDE